MAGKGTKNGKGVTKSDAMRQALAKLGNDAKTSDLQEYVQKHFGIEMDLNTTSAYKSSLTKKTKPEAGASKAVQPKTAPKAAEAPKHEKISKREGVRRALNEMGKEAMPTDIQSFLKNNYRISMSTGTISNYKSTLFKKTAGHKNGRRTARKTGSPKPAQASAHVRANGAPGGITLGDITAVKELANRLGSEKLVQLAEILA